MSLFYFRFFIALLIALVLTILPVPGLFVGLRPPWVLLLILYVQFFLPDRFSIILLIFIGLVLDALLSTVLGEHTFALSIVTWIASNKMRRFMLFTIGQQMVLIGFFCLVYQTLIVTIDAFLGYPVKWLMPLGSAALSLLFWPWIKLLADDFLFAYRRVVRH